MDLAELRNAIDDIDEQLLRLYEKRMAVAKSVAEYKKEHGLPVFQGGREEEVLQRIAEMSSAELSGGAKLLFTNIMDISKCYQRCQQSGYEPFETDTEAVQNPVVACAGIKGSYSHAAARKLFGDSDILFYDRFEQVFSAVENETIDFGVIPIENSTAGDVYLTYDLMAKHNFHIYKATSVKVDHVLAAKKNSAVKTVISHEQALRQCGEFLARGGYEHKQYLNTALAAEYVAKSDDMNIAAICSRECAGLYGLEVVADGIADSQNNYTRFICISKAMKVSEKADTIALSLSLPHTSGSLYRLLTRFAYSGLNLTKIESKPVPVNAKTENGSPFDVIFYLDFDGSINTPQVIGLLRSLERETSYFKLLGNYENV